MMLNALNDYYQRKSADPDAHMAPEGFEWKEIAFLIVLDQEGRFIQFEDTREGEVKKKIARKFLVPQGIKKTSGVAANLLWDNAEYVLGVDIKGKPERVLEQHQAFVAEIRKRLAVALVDTGVKAVLHFLDTLDIESFAALPLWQEIGASNPNLSFRLRGDRGLVCQGQAVVDALSAKRGGATQADMGVCLITGAHDEIERLHSSIKGVWGAQTSGANIVSFNLPAFSSWGKEQGGNAPIGKRAAFAYTTALNHLLSKDSGQRLQVGDASTVFWAERPNDLETLVVDAFGEPPKDDPDRNARAVQSLFKSAENGAFATAGDTTRFYVLGLAPNAARIAVRFWQVATVDELATKIRQHFDDLKIVHAAYEKPYLSLFRLLVSTATQSKADNIPPNLSGEVMRSILTGAPYPHTLLQAVVRRVRAEQGHVTYPRAALIKACINRAARHLHPNAKEEIDVSLDESNAHIGYRLGRLFAALEKIQEEANPGINATIRDRFYGAASSTPMAVFPNLMRLKNHHLAKLENRGRAVNFEKLIGQIVNCFNEFPPHLAMADQGRFAIGYYHQQQAFYTKSDKGE